MSESCDDLWTSFDGAVKSRKTFYLNNEAKVDVMIMKSDKVIRRHHKLVIVAVKVTSVCIIFLSFLVKQTSQMNWKRVNTSQSNELRDLNARQKFQGFIYTHKNIWFSATNLDCDKLGITNFIHLLQTRRHIDSH